MRIKIECILEVAKVAFTTCYGLLEEKRYDDWFHCIRGEVKSRCGDYELGCQIMEKIEPHLRERMQEFEKSNFSFEVIEKVIRDVLSEPLKKREDFQNISKNFDITKHKRIN
ncbi:MAG: hypothetical protein FWF51_03565 [Chitinivibrionia bacterium]|nr:hypothetical protein [Chitinivibrionia bacterium]